MSKAQTLLTQDEKDALVKCVQEVEKKTSGEIVPMIASTSYEYPRASLIGGLIGGGLVGIGAALAFGREDLWFFLAVFLAAFLILARLLEAFPALKKPFISKHEMREEVEEAAFTAFYANGLHHTRDLTGILIFVSVYERQVQVLADKGINDKVDPQVWQEVVAMVTEGIKAGKPGEALCQGVQRCGELVAEKFPIKADDTDELPNLIIDG
jgi:putative membrane protein